MRFQTTTGLVLLAFLIQVSSAIHRTGYQRQMQTAQEVITEGVRNNMIHSLSSLGSAVGVAGTNVSHASALLIRALVRETFSLGSVVAYVPRLLFLDGPNQFVETLRLVRSNRIQPFPNDVNGAIDNLITFTGSVRDSGISGKFAPIVEFFPNVFTGVERWVRDVVYNAFTLVGPLPSDSQQDKVIDKDNLRVAPTSTTESTV